MRSVAAQLAACTLLPRRSVQVEAAAAERAARRVMGEAEPMDQLPSMDPMLLLLQDH
jgi:hypothetical protein